MRGRLACGGLTGRLRRAGRRRRLGLRATSSYACVEARISRARRPPRGSATHGARSGTAPGRGRRRLHVQATGELARPARVLAAQLPPGESRYGAGTIFDPRILLVTVRAAGGVSEGQSSSLPVLRRAMRGLRAREPEADPARQHPQVRPAARRLGRPGPSGRPGRRTRGRTARPAASALCLRLRAARRSRRGGWEDRRTSPR